MGTTFVTLYTQLSNRLNDGGAADGFWTLVRKKQFVNDAIAHAADLGFYREVVDETLTVVASQAEYTLPSGLTRARDVVGVTVEVETNQPYAAVSRYRLITSGGGLPTSNPTVKLLLKSALPTAGKKIRVRYKAPHPPLSLDADLTEVPPEFVYHWGEFLAHSEATGRAGAPRREFHEREANLALQRFTTLIGPLLPQQPQRENPPAEW